MTARGEVFVVPPLPECICAPTGREVREISRKITVNHVAFQEPPAGAGAAGVGPEPLSHPNLRVPWSRLLLRPVVITDGSRWFYRSSTEAWTTTM